MQVRISLIQAGGFAGVSWGYEVDTAASPGPETERLVKPARALESGAAAGRQPASFLIRVEAWGRIREQKLSDGPTSDSAAELVRFLSSRAQPRRL